MILGEGGSLESNALENTRDHRPHRDDTTIDHKYAFRFQTYDLRMDNIRLELSKNPFYKWKKKQQTFETQITFINERTVICIMAVI